MVRLKGVFVFEDFGASPLTIMDEVTGRPFRRRNVDASENLVMSL